MYNETVISLAYTDGELLARRFSFCVLKNMKKIPLTRGKYALVDEDDYEVLSKSKWSLHSAGYAIRSANRKLVYMHRLVTGAKNGEYVDHINGNKLDNRRGNLRICTCVQNFWNNKVHSKATGYKGVWKNTGKRHRFAAVISVNYKRIYLGNFKTKEEAAKAYNEAAKRYKGEFAVLNVVL